MPEYDPSTDTTMSIAHSILETAQVHMRDRASTYDKPHGRERSIDRTVEMFAALTGREMTREQGWMFMACLKMVRAQSGSLRMDSYEDGAAYMALAGESAMEERGVPLGTMDEGPVETTLDVKVRRKNAF